MAAKDCTRVICAISNRDEPRIDTRLPGFVRVPARQSGDMACPEEVLKHKSPRDPECRGKAERAGILMDEHVRPGHLVSPDRPPSGRWLALPGLRQGEFCYRHGYGGGSISGCLLFLILLHCGT